MIKKVKIEVDAVFCDCCGEDLHSYDGWPYVDTGNMQYCEDCALRVGAMTPLEWVNAHKFTTRKYYKAEFEGKTILAYYKCNTPKGYRRDRWEPFYDEKL